MKKLVAFIGILCLLVTALPLLPLSHWSVRIFDFPHAQVCLLTLLSLIGALYYYRSTQLRGAIFISLLAIAFLYQITLIVPYTPLAKPQVLQTGGRAVDESLAIFSANIYMENHEAKALLETVKTYDPDVLLLLETDDWWARAVEELQNDYPYFVEVPLDNTYGMLLYSRYELIQPEVMYLIQDDIPSIQTRIALPSGSQVKFYALHPEPPTPMESESSIPRDGELMLCGKMAERDSLPVIVAGDLNDVAWSATTRLFQDVSGLLDPRIGRGFFNTFNAKYPFLRWPLDHIFHSEHFKLVRLDRLPDIGSDHFPIYIHLSLEPEAKIQQEAPEATPEEQQTADKKIREAQ